MPRSAAAQQGTIRCALRDIADSPQRSFWYNAATIFDFLTCRRRDVECANRWASAIEMPLDCLKALRQLAELVEQGFVTDEEFVEHLLAELVHSPATSVSEACELLRASAFPILISRLDAIRTDNYIVIPHMLDGGTREQEHPYAVERAPEFRRVCGAVDSWYGRK
jgi:hypothetical protein